MNCFSLITFLWYMLHKLFSKSGVFSKNSLREFSGWNLVSSNSCIASCLSFISLRRKEKIVVIMRRKNVINKSKTKITQITFNVTNSRILLVPIINLLYQIMNSLSQVINIKVIASKHELIIWIDLWPTVSAIFRT